MPKPCCYDSSEGGRQVGQPIGDGEHSRVGQQHQERQHQRSNGSVAGAGVLNGAQLLVAGNHGAPLQRHNQQQPEEREAVGEAQQAQQQQRDCEGRGTDSEQRGAGAAVLVES